jgi:hypothetical protein
MQWCVIGGWALDLWLGFESRPHGDLEVALPRTQLQALCNALSDLEPYSISQGDLRALPAGAALAPARHQVRFLDVTENAWRLDVMLDPGDAETWIYRRDESLRAPRQQLIGGRGSIPYMKPEVVLFFKAKAPREKDERDFELCLAHLPRDGQVWLSRCLQDHYPHHPWLQRLRER